MNSNIKIISGDVVTNLKPFFSYDSKFLIVPNFDQIRIFDITLGVCKGVIRSDDENDFVYACLNTKYKLQLLAISKSGSFITYDLNNGHILKKYKLNIPQTVFAQINNTLLYFIMPNRSGKKYDVCCINSPLYDSSAHATSIKLKYLLYEVENDPHKISFHLLNKFIAAVSHNKLMVLFLNQNDITASKLTSHLIGSDRYFTCVSSHPTDLCLATGDNTGRILIWTNLHDKHPIKSIYHWHSLPLNCLTFSSHGSYLLSGSQECVLVKWDLKNEDKSFMPRFEAPIVDIITAENNNLIAIRLKDQSIKIMGFNYEFPTQLHISGLLIDYVDRNNSLRQKMLGNANRLIHDSNNINTVLIGEDKNLLYNLICSKLDSLRRLEIGLLPFALKQNRALYNKPSNPKMVTNGPTGYIQCYDAYEDRLVFKLDICGQNRKIRSRHEQPSNVIVTRVAFDTSRPTSYAYEYMATFQLLEHYLNQQRGVNQDFNQFSPEYVLKFWCFNREKRSYVLNTTIPFPHDFNAVSNMIFYPSTMHETIDEFNNPSDNTSIRNSYLSNLRLLTLSDADPIIRIWAITFENIPSINVVRHYWSCVSRIRYSYDYIPTGAITYKLIERIPYIAIVFAEKTENYNHNLMLNELSELPNEDSTDICMREGKECDTKNKIVLFTLPKYCNRGITFNALLEQQGNELAITDESPSILVSSNNDIKFVTYAYNQPYNRDHQYNNNHHSSLYIIGINFTHIYVCYFGVKRLRDIINNPSDNYYQMPYIHQVIDINESVSSYHLTDSLVTAKSDNEPKENVPLSNKKSGNRYIITSLTKVFKDKTIVNPSFNTEKLIESQSETQKMQDNKIQQQKTFVENCCSLYAFVYDIVDDSSFIMLFENLFDSSNQQSTAFTKIDIPRPPSFFAKLPLEEQTFETDIQNNIIDGHNNMILHSLYIREYIDNRVTSKSFMIYFMDANQRLYKFIPKSNKKTNDPIESKPSFLEHYNLYETMHDPHLFSIEQKMLMDKLINDYGKTKKSTNKLKKKLRKKLKIPPPKTTELIKLFDQKANDPSQNIVSSDDDNENNMDQHMAAQINPLQASLANTYHTKKEKAKQLKDIIENCPAHTFPGISDFSLAVMESQLKPAKVQDSKHKKTNLHNQINDELEQDNGNYIRKQSKIPKSDRIINNINNIENTLISDIFEKLDKISLDDPNTHKKKRNKKLKIYADESQNVDENINHYHHSLENVIKAIF